MADTERRFVLDRQTLVTAKHIDRQRMTAMAQSTPFSETDRWFAAKLADCRARRIDAINRVACMMDSEETGA